MFLPPDVLEWPLNVVVVRSGGQTILIDAGLGVEFPDFPRAGRLALRLEAAGIDPASVTDVVLTHMHMDHVGGLLADGLKRRLRHGGNFTHPSEPHADSDASRAPWRSHPAGRHAGPPRVRDGIGEPTRPSFCAVGCPAWTPAWSMG
jgi:glyoxylase-like metal-dependent hydrolase (beta-lactamase superfamily II)